MKTFATLVAAALIALPSAAAAACSWHEQTAQGSCAEGQVWDAQTRTCVTTTG